MTNLRPHACCVLHTANEFVKKFIIKQKVRAQLAKLVKSPANSHLASGYTRGAHIGDEQPRVEMGAREIQARPSACWLS